MAAPSARNRLTANSAPSLVPKNARRLKQPEAASTTGYCLQASGGQGAPAALTMPSVTSDSATFEAWIQTTSEAEQAIFLSQNDSGGLCVIELAANALWLYWYPSDTSVSLYSKDVTVVADGQWHHIAVVFDHGVIRIYKDGVLTGDALSVPGGQSTGTSLGIGGYSSRVFDGQIYGVRVWNTARSTAQIQGYMFTELTGQEAGLVGLVALCTFENGAMVNQVTGQDGTLTSNGKIIEATVPSTPPAGEVWTLTTTGTVATPPTLATGAIVYCENMIPVPVQRPGYSDGRACSIDIQSGGQNWTYDASTGLTGDFSMVEISHTLGSLGNAVYAAVTVSPSNEELPPSLYVDEIDIRTGARLWRAAVDLGQYGYGQQLEFTSFPAEANGLVMLGGMFQQIQDLTYGGVFVALDTAASGAQAWHIAIPNLVDPKPLPLSGFTRAVISNGIAVFGANYNSDFLGSAVTVYAVNPASGTILWTKNLPGAMDAAAPLIANNTVYVGTGASLIALSLQTGEQLWSFSTNGNIESRPAVVGNTVYLGSMDGDFYAVQVTPAASGPGYVATELWRVPIGNGGISTDIALEDGIAYFGTAGDQATLVPTIYAVDLATEGNDVVSYTIPNGDVVLSDAVANGIVYFYSSSTVYAVNMSNVMHEFNVQTALMVENYDTTKSPPVGTDTAYRVTITLMDPAKKPRPFQAVKLSAVGTLTVTSGLQTYTISPTQPQPLWLQTDGSGQVVIAINGVVDPAAPLLHCPALIAWASFMQPNEAIVIYPDHDNLSQLATMQATNPDPSDPDSKGLDTAKGYNGQPVLQSAYQDENSRQQIADAIKNTVGNRNTASAPRGSASSSTKYLAFPEYMPFATYQPQLGDTSRAFAPGAVPDWQLSYAAGVSFTPLSSAEAEEHFKAHFRQGPPGAPGSIFTDIEDFFENVIHGVEEVAEATWHWTEGAVETIIKTAENEYHLIISKIEDAITAVVGFIKKVIYDIKEFFQFLSYLFDFKDILNTQNEILSGIQTGLGNLQTWIDNEISIGLPEVTGLFASWEGKVNGYFGTLIGGLQGQTIETYHAQNNDPNVAYRHNGKDRSSQCTWFTQKLKDNVGGSGNSSGTAGMTIRGGRNAALMTPFPRQKLAESVPGDDPIAAIGLVVDDFFGALYTNSGVAEATGATDNLFTTLPELFSDPNTFLQNGLADILTLLKDIADALLDIGNDLAKFLLKIVQAVLNAIMGVVDAPLSIPIISDLYKAITGQELTFLNLIALLVAIPTTIITKLMNALSTPEAGSPFTEPGWSDDTSAKIANGIGLIIGGIIDPLATLASIPDAPSMLRQFFGILNDVDTAFVFFNLITQPWILEGGTIENVQDGVFWATALFPIASNVYAMYGASDNGSANAKSYSETGWYYGNFIYGIVYAVLSVVYAVEWPDDYTAVDTVINILGGSLPFLLDPLRQNEADVPDVALAKLLCEEVAAIMTFLNYFVIESAGSDKPLAP